MKILGIKRIPEVNWYRVRLDYRDPKYNQPIIILIKSEHENTVAAIEVEDFAIKYKTLSDNKINRKQILLDLEREGYIETTMYNRFYSYKLSTYLQALIIEKLLDLGHIKL